MNSIICYLLDMFQCNVCLKLKLIFLYIFLNLWHFPMKIEAATEEIRILFELIISQYRLGGSNFIRDCTVNE